MPDDTKPVPHERVGPETLLRTLDLTRVEPSGGDATAPPEFEAVLSVGAPVRRYDWNNGRYVSEELAMTAEALDLSRFNAGASVLDSHDRWGVSSVLGNIVPGSARLENGQLKARLRFDPQDERTRKITEGFVRTLSIGYSVSKWQTDETTDPPTVRALRWQPYEVSVVSVPADPAALVALAGRNAFSALTGPFLEENMDKTTEETRSQAGNDAGGTTPAAPAAGTQGAPVDATRAVADERARVSEIMTLCQRSNNADMAPGFIADGSTPDQVRAKLFEKMAAAQPSTGVSPGGRDASDPLPRQRAMIGAIMLRAGSPAKLQDLAEPGRVTAEQVADQARDYANMSLLRMAEECLSIVGVNTRRLNPMEIVGRALGMDRAGGMMTTTDFPILLTEASRRSLRAAYALLPQNWREFVSVTRLNDFRAVKRVQTGEFDKLLKIPEHGEYKSAAFSEQGELIQLATYGRKTSLSRQAIINDDLAAFNRIPRAFAAAAAATESETVWGLVTGNPVMADGKTVFHSGHKNLAATGALPSVATLSDMRKAFINQKGLDGALLELIPEFILAPSEQQTLLDQLLADLSRYVPTSTGGVNPFAGKLKPITSPYLDLASTTAWYAMASPDRIETIEVAYLNGVEGIYTESQVSFDVDGIETKARLDIGASWIDFRGAYKNPGA